MPVASGNFRCDKPDRRDHIEQRQFRISGENQPAPIRNQLSRAATMRRMKAKHPFFVSLATLAFCAGCASSGPSTERGAATGAALGAVGGAILGNNVGGGGHHALLGAALGAAAGGVAGGVYGNRRDQQNGTAQQIIPPTDSSAQAQYGGYVQNPPPTPTSEPQDTYTPQPSPNSVWVRGHYEYTGDGRDYQWVPGHWEVPPTGSRTYVAGHWQQESQGYVWVPGGWQ